jgi:hypothetical protein
VTALSLVQQAAGELGLPQPSGSLYSSSDGLVQQFAALSNREGIDLSRRHQWQNITKSTTFTTVAAQLQTAFLPSDFDRFCNDSMWNTSIARKVYGPMTEQDWQQYQAFPIFTSVNPAFIVRESQFYLQPAPAAGQTLSYSYVSKNWCESSGGTEQSAFAADTDVGLIPETLITLGIIWRFKKAKGFDYAEDFRTYNQQVEQWIARDGGAPKLNLTYGLNRFQPYPYNVPEGNWP